MPVPNKDNFRKWVARLRDPEAKQGHGKLGTTDGKRCCLGVACDIAVEENVIRPPVIPGDKALRYDGATGYLPSSVAEWLGVRGDTVYVKVPEHSQPISVVYLNDVDKLSFSEIADAIEETYLKDTED